MARGQNKSQFKWYEEPGIHRITFQEIPSEKHKVEFIIDSSSEDYGTVIDNYDEVFRCAIPKKLLATMFYYEFKKISALLKDKNYSKNREFPFKEFTLFEKEILEYIN
ncbi:MAG: hypothetical protein KGV44_11870 [Flavobacteriaceae bacterium]|nr:hypothetical protein [Flavobacteriaceae bacterium]